MLIVEYAKYHTLVLMVVVSNINIYQLKAEGNYRTLHFIHCDNFRLFGLAGNASPFPSDVNSQTGVGAPYNTYQNYNQNILMTGNANGDCSNFLVANQAFQIPTKDFDTAYGTSLGAITEQFVLYKRENPQPTVP